MTTYITNTFTAQEAKTAEIVWATSTDTGKMFAVEILAANDRLITVDFQGRKMSFTNRWEQWRTEGYVLAIDEV
jgi:hypothetical protein